MRRHEVILPHNLSGLTLASPTTDQPCHSHFAALARSAPSPPCRARRTVETIASDEAHRPFNLVHDLLLRTTLLRLAEEEHRLVGNNAPHCLRWLVMAVLVEELSLLYSAYAEGKPCLALISHPICRFHTLAAPAPGRGKNGATTGVSRKQLSGVPPVLELPTDHPRHASNRLWLGTANFQLDATPTSNCEVDNRRNFYLWFYRLGFPAS